VQFTYTHGIPTVEQAMRQGVAAYSRRVTPIGVSANAVLDTIATETLSEVRNILTSEMATLFDLEDVALDWNTAVETCIQLVEGAL
jgi:hypothetical protein